MRMRRGRMFTWACSQLVLSQLVRGYGEGRKGVREYEHRDIDYSQHLMSSTNCKPPYLDRRERRQDARKPTIRPSL
ncbi:hypothetical protein EDB87DRAFT_1597121 [Lactarius vividus]|nr:hypothetical protein EDB87DRAFT_1597121 [Lactarius vividus]